MNTIIKSLEIKKKLMFNLIKNILACLRVTFQLVEKVFSVNYIGT